MPALGYRGWFTIPYVLAPVPLTYSYNSSLAVHTNNVIHGDLTGVSVTHSTIFGLINYQL
jgi:hypothetical protein